jgi:outer membrane protein assembly factor BamB
MRIAHMHPRTLSLVALLFCAGVTLGADNWPHWRGPASTGASAESGLPTTWSKTENVAWRTSLDGAGVSSPIVWGDRIYVTAQIGRGERQAGNHPRLAQGADAAKAGEGTLTAGAAVAKRDRVGFLVTALDRTTGRRVWQHETAAEGVLPGVHDKHNLATPSPVTDGERVYAWFGTGQIVALDAGGKQIWTRHLGKEQSPFEINWGHASSPLLYADTVLLLCLHEQSSYLIALDKRTGKDKWKVDWPAGVTSYSTPVVANGPNGPELIVNTSRGVEALDPATGERRWQFDETNRFPIPVAIPHGDMIYMTRGYRSSPYLAIKLGGRGNVTTSHVQWRVPTGGPYVPSLVFYDGLLYMAGELGIVSAIDVTNGERIWQERIGGLFTASPVAGDGKVYLVSESGETVVLAAGRTPKILARNQLDGHFVASPAIAGGRLVLRADDSVIAVGK